MLRAASVFGELCWDGGVTALLDGAMGPPLVGEWLSKLIEQELLVVQPNSRFSGQRELAFRHALLREGAYATLDRGRPAARSPPRGLSGSSSTASATPWCWPATSSAAEQACAQRAGTYKRRSRPCSSSTTTPP